MEKYLSRILITKTQLKLQIKAIASAIYQDYKDKPNFLMIGLLKGCNPFFIDLLHELKLDPYISYMSASSYVDTSSTGVLNIKLDCDVDVKDKDILVVDDILDTGLTLETILKTLYQKGASSIKTCVLLSKNIKRNYQADYCGFHINNEFVIGYGLDYNQKYRNLPFIGIYNLDYEKK